MRAGARGYVLKGADQEEMVRTIDAVARGEAHFGAAIAQRLMVFLPSRTTCRLTLFPGMTDREREVLDLIAQGAEQ